MQSRLNFFYEENKNFYVHFPPEQLSTEIHKSYIKWKAKNKIAILLIENKNYNFYLLNKKIINFFDKNKFFFKKNKSKKNKIVIFITKISSCKRHNKQYKCIYKIILNKKYNYVVVTSSDLINSVTHKNKTLQQCTARIFNKITLFLKNIS